jgi:hypothetical protein
MTASKFIDMAAYAALGALLVTVVGCSDTARSRLAALGQPGEITCYSGGKEIYHGFSTGKVFNADNSDGYEFQEAGTNKLVRITADCIVKN